MLFLGVLFVCFHLGKTGFLLHVFANRVCLQSWLEADLIYSAMVIHMGDDSTGKSRLVDHNKFGPGANCLHQLGLDIKLRSSVKFIRASVAHAVSRINKIMVKYK